MAPPKDVCPKLAQVIVETRVVLERIRNLYGLERRKEQAVNGRAVVGPDR